MKPILILSLFVLCSVGSYHFFKPNPSAQIDLTLRYIKEKQFAAADEAIRSIPSKSYPVFLYKGYLEQARGRFIDSNRYLHHHVKNSLEAKLALATNAFFENRHADFLNLVEKAKSHPSIYLSFYEGLAHYIQGEYKEALNEWASYNSASFLQESPWTEAMIEQFFPESWLQIHMAHCLTEEGDILKSREILENEGRKGENANIKPLTTLLLGLTYLREAQHIPLDLRGSYYTLAHFYFEQSGNSALYACERDLLIPIIKQEAEGLIVSNVDKEKLKWGFNFLHILLDWKGDQEIQSIARLLASEMLDQNISDSITLCSLVREEFLGTSFQALLTQNLLDLMQQDLKRGHVEGLEHIWSMVEILSPSPGQMAKLVAGITTEQLFHTIQKDGNTLTNTKRYINFLENLGQNQQERESLARDLFSHAQLFWQQEGREEKGECLTDLALQLAVNKNMMGQQVESFLTKLYKRAESSNLIERLIKIFDAMDHFGISKQEWATPNKLANQLADAQYLYQACNYSLCKAHSLWVLKLDPQNENAQKLVGLSSFHLGEYTEALTFLKKLDTLDDDAHKVLALSQAFAAQEQEKHFCRIDESPCYCDAD